MSGNRTKLQLSDPKIETFCKVQNLMCILFWVVPLDSLFCFWFLQTNSYELSRSRSVLIFDFWTIFGRSIWCAWSRRQHYTMKWDVMRWTPDGYVVSSITKEQKKFILAYWFRFIKLFNSVWSRPLLPCSTSKSTDTEGSHMEYGRSTNNRTRLTQMFLVPLVYVLIANYHVLMLFNRWLFKVQGDITCTY